MSTAAGGTGADLEQLVMSIAALRALSPLVAGVSLMRVMNHNPASVNWSKRVKIRKPRSKIANELR